MIDDECSTPWVWWFLFNEIKGEIRKEWSTCHLSFRCSCPSPLSRVTGMRWFPGYSLFSPRSLLQGEPKWFNKNNIPVTLPFKKQGGTPLPHRSSHLPPLQIIEQLPEVRGKPIWSGNSLFPTCLFRCIFQGNEPYRRTSWLEKQKERGVKSVHQHRHHPK